MEKHLGQVDVSGETISPEMIAAGAAALADYRDVADEAGLALVVYTAMSLAAARDRPIPWWDVRSVLRNGTDGRVSEIEKILRDEISLAEPDDLGFLKFQVPDIAARIDALLCSPGVREG